MERLESIVAQIESGEIGLEESMALYEEGIELTQRCKEILATAEQRVEALSRRTQEGKPVAIRPNSAAALADKGTVSERGEPAGDDSDSGSDAGRSGSEGESLGDGPDGMPDEDDDSGPDAPRRAGPFPEEPPF